MAGALQHSRMKAKEKEPSKAKEKQAARKVSKEQKVKAKANVGNVDKQDTARRDACAFRNVLRVCA